MGGKESSLSQCHSFDDVIRHRRCCLVMLHHLMFLSLSKCLPDISKQEAKSTKSLFGDTVCAVCTADLSICLC